MAEENPNDGVQIEAKTEEQNVQEQIISNQEEQIVSEQIESNQEMQINDAQIPYNQELQENEAQIESNQEEQVNVAEIQGEAPFEGEEKKEEDIQKEQIIDKMEIGGDSAQKDKIDIFEANAIIGSTTEQRYAQLDQNQLNRPTKTLGLLNELSNQLNQENQAAQAQAMQAENQGGYQGYPAGFMSGYHGYQGGLVNTMPGQSGTTQSQNLDDTIEKKIQQLKLKLSGSRNNAPGYMQGGQMAPEMQDMQGMSTKIPNQEGQNMMGSPLGSYKRFNDLFSMINTEAQGTRPQVNTQYTISSSEYKPKQPKPYTGSLSPSARFDIATPSTFSYKPKPMGYAALVEKQTTPSRNIQIGFGSGTYSPRMYEIGNTKSVFTTGNKEFAPSKTANPAYMKFAKNYGASRQLHFITEQFAQKMKDDNTKANLNYLAENSGKRCLRTSGNYNRGYYTGTLSTLDTRLFPGGTNLRTRYKS